MKAMRPNLTHEESLLLDLWEAVEDQADTETADAIADMVGWPALIGTVAGLREKSAAAAIRAEAEGVSTPTSTPLTQHAPDR